MPMPPTIDRDLLVEVLLARETTGTTAIGEGIAIPHVRNPVIAAGARAAVAVCYLAHPVSLGARGGPPVHTILMLVTPTVRAHLQLLARLARALTDPGFKAALDRRAALDDLTREAARVERDAPPAAGHEAQETSE
jgi:PTS system nitrogen regulatory IIA component